MILWECTRRNPACTGFRPLSTGLVWKPNAPHRPLFPGKDYVDQLKLIIKTLGTPSEDDLTFIGSHKARAYIRALPPSQVRANSANSSCCARGTLQATCCPS